MNRSMPATRSPRHPLAARPGVADTLEWEELPSLAQALQRYRERGTVAAGAAQAWNPTRPMPLSPEPAHPAASPVPFAEVIAGLHTRELDGPELFEHFFGRTPGGHTPA